jgi:hypothetical protein
VSPVGWPKNQPKCSRVARRADPSGDPITVRRGNRERCDAFQECGGINHLLGEEDANEFAVLFAKGDELARGEVMSFQAVTGTLPRSSSATSHAARMACSSSLRVTPPHETLRRDPRV